MKISINVILFNFLFTEFLLSISSASFFSSTSYPVHKLTCVVHIVTYTVAIRPTSSIVVSNYGEKKTQTASEPASSDVC